MKISSLGQPIPSSYRSKRDIKYGHLYVGIARNNKDVIVLAIKEFAPPPAWRGADKQTEIYVVNTPEDSDWKPLIGKIALHSLYYTDVWAEDNEA